MPCSAAPIYHASLRFLYLSLALNPLRTLAPRYLPDFSQTSMEFWGVEVKAGKPLKVKPDDHKYLHLSQAALGETKKGNESVTVFLNIGDQKLVLGILSADKFPQLSFDLVFEKEFELSHNSKNGSVHLCGYQTFGPEEGEEFSDFDSDEEEEELIPLQATDNGKIAPKKEEAKPAKANANVGRTESSQKPQAKPAELKKEEPDEEDDSDDESDDEEDSGEDSDEDMLNGDTDDDEDDDSDEDDETPKKAEGGKKRPNDSATKTSASAKKPMTATPSRTDGKKGGHQATPHPAKPKTGTPNSGSQVNSKSGKKPFASGNRAKHGRK